MKDNSYRLVLVEWIDAFGCSDRWADMDDVKPSVPICCSVGFLVAETDDALLVVPHVAFGEHVVKEGQGCGDMTIPKVAVKSMVDLLIPDGREAAEIAEGRRDVREGRTRPFAEVRRELMSDDEPMN
jgi:hypothetical protein